MPGTMLPDFLYHGTRCLHLQNLQGPSPPGLGHLWQAIQTTMQDFVDIPCLIFHELISFQPQNPVAVLTYGGKIINRILDETNNFSSMVSLIPDMHPDKPNFINHDQTFNTFSIIRTPPEFRTQDYRNATRPTYAAVIPTKMFLVLLAIMDEFNEDLTEDNFKQVIINISFDLSLYPLTYISRSSSPTTWICSMLAISQLSGPLHPKPTR
jgi:hypothetical protein